jgi:hypothetical protein
MGPASVMVFDVAMWGAASLVWGEACAGICAMQAAVRAAMKVVAHRVTPRRRASGECHEW